MNGAPTTTAFLNEVWTLVPTARRTILEQAAAARARIQHDNEPRVCFHDGIASTGQTLHLGTTRAQITASNSQRIVVVAENINLRWITELGTALDIPAAPFARHMCNPEGAEPWSAVFAPYLERTFVTDLEPSGTNGHFWSVDGVYSLDLAQHVSTSPTNVSRITSSHAEYGVQFSTRVTCWSGTCLRNGGANKRLYLFLVDPQPFAIQDLKVSIPLATFLRLQLPVSKNRGGLALPSLFTASHPCLFAELDAFLCHEWQFNALFPPIQTPIASPSFLYLLAASSLQSNARYLDRRVKKIAYEDIRRPSLETNDQLHECRRLLMNVREQAEMAKVWMPDTVSTNLQSIHTSFPDPRPYFRQPSATLDDLVAALNELERFLMDSFNLLMSSISVQQNEKSQRLTILAFIYIPLSFVTGVFGMNIAEINGATPAWWAVLVALIITLIITVAIFWSSIMASTRADNRRSATTLVL